MSIDPHSKNNIPSLGGKNTSTTEFANINSTTIAGVEALDTVILGSDGLPITSFGSPNQQYVGGSSRGTATGTLQMIDDGTNIQSRAGDSNGNAYVVGNKSSASADSGNPVKTGGIYNSSRPTFTTGQRGDTQIDSRGATFVTLSATNGANTPGIVSVGDAQTAQTGIATFGQTLIYNNTNWDRQRNNYSASLIAAGTTTTQSNQTFTTFNAQKLIILVNITAGAGSLVVAINGVSASSYSYNILTSASLLGVSATALRVFPGATAAANLTANDMIPRTISITATVTGSITYGIDYILSV